MHRKLKVGGGPLSFLADIWTKCYTASVEQHVTPCKTLSVLAKRATSST